MSSKSELSYILYWRLGIFSIQFFCQHICLCGCSHTFSLSVCIFVSSSVYLFVYLFVQLFLPMDSIVCPCISLSLSLCARFSVCLYIYLIVYFSVSFFPLIMVVLYVQEVVTQSIQQLTIQNGSLLLGHTVEERV